MQYSHHEVEKDFVHIQQNKSLNYFIDSTLLKIDLTEKDISNLCHEAIELKFRTICIPPCYVNMATNILRNQVPICTVVGFPNGYNSTECKCQEIKQAINDGVSEIDFVQNITLVKSNNYRALENEFQEILKITQNKVTKVILETSLLTEEEIFKCTLLAAECGIHIIKTSTGFGERGASLKDIEIIKMALLRYEQNSQIRVGIKASGGIRSKEDAIAFMKAGVTRLGTSNGKKIVYL